MLVYGDVESLETLDGKRADIEDLLAQADRLPPGIERHAALVAAFIGTSELVQALIDAEFQERGFDARSVVHESGMACLSLMARSVARSWRNGFAGDIPPLSCLTDFSDAAPSRLLRIKHAEGYAFYALYPESYVEAAMRSGLGPQTRVIGIRSIGAGLSALVAATLSAPSPITVRPGGHPFRREVLVDPKLTEEMTADRTADFAIVDEGPGLSGSSFGAVADWLESAGVPRERIHFFPSHKGDLGPQASQDHRERWRSAPRHVIEADEIILQSQPPHHLASWIGDIVGPLSQPLEDVSGGAWRSQRYPDEESWPAANVQHERRKFLARAGDATWLVKFIGLGEVGLRKHRRALQLHQAGFSPQVAGYRHGFLIERWHEDAVTLDRCRIDRERLVEQIGSYLVFRVRCCRADQSRGASLEDLRHMACYNTGQALGDEAAAILARVLPKAESLEGAVRRVETDNRMHPWEWLVLGERLIKTDAVDHSATHDLVGPQDITWDIAGAATELDLSDHEVQRLCAIVRRESAAAVSAELLSFIHPCYLAFQLGAHTMAAAALGEGAEAERLRRAANRYARLLEKLIRETGSTAAAGTTGTDDPFTAKA